MLIWITLHQIWDGWFDSFTLYFPQLNLIGSSYVPPDQEGISSGNQIAGKHALGSRARNLQTTGELTVRFEMPFPIWCSTCQPTESVLIGQGVRFNALKKKVGDYYTTPIYRFRMKHSVCGGWIEIKTDPQNTEYVVTEGARRKVTAELGKGEYEESSTGAGEIRIRMPGSKEEGGGAGGEPDPFAKFEGKVADHKGFMDAKTRMEELIRRQERDWEDPYEQSKRLRRSFRAGRKNREKTESITEELKDKLSLGIDLLDETESDRLRAGLVDFAPQGSVEDGSALSLPSSIRSRPLFAPPPSRNLNKIGQGDGRVGKKRRKAADLTLQRKMALQQSLSGNTRAAIDPFLTDDTTSWKQNIASLKRRKQKSETPLVGVSRGGNHRGRIDEEQSKRNDEYGLRVGDRGDDAHNIGDDYPMHLGSKGTAPEKPLPLVGYGSDSDG